MSRLGLWGPGAAFPSFEVRHCGRQLPRVAAASRLMASLLPCLRRVLAYCIAQPSLCSSLKLLAQPARQPLADTTAALASPRHPPSTPQSFLDSMKKRGITFLELLSMELKGDGGGEGGCRLCLWACRAGAACAAPAGRALP